MSNLCEKLIDTSATSPGTNGRRGQSVRQSAHLPGSGVVRLPPGRQDVGGRTIPQCRARPSEPTANAGVVVGAREVADDQRQRVQTDGDLGRVALSPET